MDSDPILGRGKPNTVELLYIALSLDVWRYNGQCEASTENGASLFKDRHV